jgi:bifunctional DNA-binding transcriptional regulator/antitoxin component of YhaV-PrlF toxin-antitoxin module
MLFIATVSTRGRVTIPIELRRKLGWNFPMKVTIRDVSGKLLIEPWKRNAHGGRKRHSGPSYSPISRTT